MKLVMVLYVNGIRTDKEVDLNRLNDILSIEDSEYEIDPRSEWAQQVGASQDHQELLKLNISDIPHEWKIETQSERGDELPEGWSRNE